MSTIEVKVPDIGDFTDVPVIEVFVKPGDTVAAEDSLVTLESDKATMDVPSPAAGTVKEVRVKLGDKVSEGSLIVVLEADGAGAAEARCRAQPQHRRSQRRRRPRQRQHPLAPPRPARRHRRRNREAPRRRRLPVDEEAIQGARTRRRRCASSRASSASICRASQATGPKDRILQEDVQDFVKQAMSGAGPRRCGRRSHGRRRIESAAVAARSISRNSARSRRGRCRASRRSPAPISHATG